MANAKKRSIKPSAVYLTKRKLVSAARAGIRKAAEETMQVMGYTIIAYRGWIIKKYADGRIEKISPYTTCKNKRHPCPRLIIKPGFRKYPSNKKNPSEKTEGFFFHGSNHI